MRSDSMFKTKRFLYDILEKNVLYKPSCSSIIGSRKIGKTILLLQLEENHKEDTIYIDGSISLKGRVDFKSLYEGYIEKGIKNVLIDEVCKIDEELISDFISVTKLYSSKLCFIITGSVGVSVSKICDSIGRGGEEYVLPPIMYIEYLCWGSGILNVNLKDIKKLTNYDKYILYIKRQNIGTTSNHLQYIKEVVSDTLDSYLRRTSLGDNRLDISMQSIYDAVKYISVCQFVYESNSKDFISIPTLSQEVRDELGEEYKKVKARWNLSKRTIKYVISLLYGCNLARETGIYEGSSLNVENVNLADNTVSACVFEYPWLSSLCLSSLVQNDDSFIDLWVENSILLRESYIYPFYDKYRNDNKNEIDTIYEVDYGNFHGLEVKNRPCENVTRSYISNIKNLSKRVGLEDIYLTCSDNPEGDFKDIFLSLDKVVAGMELEYMSLLSEGKVYSTLSVDKIVEKYFG
jgi:hypothetical protein